MSYDNVLTHVTGEILVSTWNATLGLKECLLTFSSFNPTTVDILPVDVISPKSSMNPSLASDFLVNLTIINRISIPMFHG